LKPLLIIDDLNCDLHRRKFNNCEQRLRPSHIRQRRRKEHVEVPVRAFACCKWRGCCFAAVVAVIHVIVLAVCVAVSLTINHHHQLFDAQLMFFSSDACSLQTLIITPLNPAQSASNQRFYNRQTVLSD
jgi:hypothetical protein